MKKEELEAFIGLNFLFGYHRLPQARNYWSSDFDYSVAIVPTIMTRDRCFQILSNLYILDNSCIPDENTDRLYNIRPLIEALNQKFMQCRFPEQSQSIDESMIKFKVRSSLKQFNPVKSIKRGYKFWCRSW